MAPATLPDWAHCEIQTVPSINTRWWGWRGAGWEGAAEEEVNLIVLPSAARSSLQQDEQMLTLDVLLDWREIRAGELS